MTILEHPEAVAILADATVTTDAFRARRAHPARFLKRYLPWFYREEQRGHVAGFVLGPLGVLERKSVEPIARQVGIFTLFAVISAFFILSVHEVSADSNLYDDFANLQEMATKIVDSINSMKENELYSYYSIGYKKNPRISIQSTAYLIKKIIGDRGRIIRIHSPEIVNNWGQYELEAVNGRWLMEVSVDGEGLIEGLSFKDAPQILPVPERNQIAVHLPLKKNAMLMLGV